MHTTAPTPCTRLSRRPSARRFWLTLGLAAAAALFSPANASAARAYVPPDDPELLTAKIVRADDEKTLSAYFVVLGESGSVDALPLKFTAADVQIAGVIADVTVTQVYANTGSVPIEAKYVFPASTRAAVYGMTMTIGERTIEADIQRKADARATYEQARAEGRSASLLEQQRPNVFEMNVANIMPGDEIQVVLRYTEMLVPEAGIYEFVYPTVVGPRFSDTPVSEASNDVFVSSPYLHEGEAAPYGFDFTAHLTTGLPIQGIGSPSHPLDIQFEGPTHAMLSLSDKEPDGGNRDVVVRYRLAGGQIEGGLMLYEGEDEHFFMLMAQPPRRITPEVIPPREYIFIVDVSGSMNGYPLDISKKLMRDLIGGLRPTDTFNVVLFASASNVMADRSVQANTANMERAVAVIDNQRGGGGTQLLAAMKTALALPKTQGVSRSLVLVTDGYISVEDEAFDLIRNGLDDANVFTFGIGTSVNRHLIEGLARVGQGEPQVITRPEEAPEKAAAFRQYIASPVLTSVSAHFKGLDVYDIEPPSIPDVLADRPVVVVGKYRGSPQGEIVLKGWSGEGAWSQRFDVAKVRPLPENDGLRYLWARQRIATLDDYNSLGQSAARVEQVTQLGLDYNLLTQYTSFVAVDSLRRNDGGAVHVDQPLPLPEGVSDLAIGSSMPVMQGAVGMTGSGMGGGGYGAAAMPYRAKKEVGRSSSPRPAPPVRTREQTRKSSADEDLGQRSLDAAPAEMPVELAAAEVDKAHKAPLPANVQIGIARSTVALEAGVLDAAARAHQAQLVGWLTQARASEPGLAGAVTLRLHVDAAGAVTLVEVVRGDKAVTGSASLPALQAALQRWLLPSPTDGLGGTFELRLIFG